jgi:hypothetical protein
VDVVIVTADSFGWRGPEEFADDYFDYGPDPANQAEPGPDRSAGYGQGPERSGVLLAINLETRDWAVSTRGAAINVFTDRREDQLMGPVLERLASDDWDGAFNEFVSQVDAIYTNASRFRWEVVVGVALAAGLLGGLIPVTIWRRQLKSVRPAVGAKPYLQTAGLVLAVADERFLGESTVVIDQTPPGGAGGGSSTHFGSSGARHGGFSGKF